MIEPSNKSTDDKSKQYKGKDGRMHDKHTTSNHVPCEAIRNLEHRTTVLEGKTEQHDKELEQQRKEMDELNEGIWKMFNTINTKLSDVLTGMSNLGLINGNQDEKIRKLEQCKKDERRDKKQNWRSLRDLGIGAFLSFIFLVILSYVLPPLLRQFHLLN